MPDPTDGYSESPMRVPLAVPDLSGREAEYLQECVTSTFVSTAGPFVRRFEDELARLSGTDDACAMCSGTVAIQIALETAGVGRDDLVVVPSLTFIATANAVRHTGADVWLFDCSARDWTLDAELVRAELLRSTDPHPDGRRHRETGRVVKAIVPVMIMGASIDFDAYVTLGREFGLEIVVDAAAAIGASTFDGAPIGQSGVAAVCYSFNGNKTITSGGGGAVASSDSSFVERARHLVTTGRVGTDYDHDVVAYNFRITNVEAAIGCAQLERLDQFLERKRTVAHRYADLAAEHPDLQPFPTPARGRSTHWFSGLFYTGDDPASCESFRASMRAQEIDVRPFWKPVHLQMPYRAALSTAMPIADGIWDRIVPLPCSNGITDDELDFVDQRARSFWFGHDGSPR